MKIKSINVIFLSLLFILIFPFSFNISLSKRSSRNATVFGRSVDILFNNFFYQCKATGYYGTTQCFGLRLIYSSKLYCLKYFGLQPTYLSIIIFLIGSILVYATLKEGTSQYFDLRLINFLIIFFTLLDYFIIFYLTLLILTVSYRSQYFSFWTIYSS